MTLAAASGAALLGVTYAATPFIGGVVGLLGVDIIREKAKTVLNKRGNNDAA
ncbi:phage holin family protein [Aeromonas veronii]